jgi:hypothetical protein
MKRKIGNYKICVDKGFPQSGAAHGMFVGPITKRAVRGIHCEVHDYLLRISNVHMSPWQASEWGMRGMQGTFPRCKKCLPSDHALYRLVIEAIVLVHNFRTDCIGYNQVKTVFDLEYVWIENLWGCNQIAQSYFCPGDYDSKVDGDGTDNDNESNEE